MFSDFLRDLTFISPRYGKGEQEAAKLIESCLKKASLPYEVQSFTAKVPLFKASLTADGQEVSCLGSSLVSGNLDSSTPILSYTQASSKDSVIYYSPTSLGIYHNSNHAKASLAVNKDSVDILKNAKNVKGTVLVTPYSFTSQNFLVGNTLDPKKVIFSHYDSIVGPGANDNAVAVDILMDIVTSKKSLLEDHLFVFVGNEESSYAKPFSWCHGYEVFDLLYSSLLDQCQEIIVLDGLGSAPASFITSDLDEVFMISRLSQLKSKILWLHDSQETYLKYGHTYHDTLDNIDQKYILQAKELLLSRL